MHHRMLLCSLIGMSACTVGLAVAELDQSKMLLIGVSHPKMRKRHTRLECELCFFERDLGIIDIRDKNGNEGQKHSIAAQGIEAREENGMVRSMVVMD